MKTFDLTQHVYAQVITRRSHLGVINPDNNLWAYLMGCRKVANDE